ncbi:ABC transporter substrate-binding protein [Polaribacter sp.]|jgi:iron complex transport system substrate-binding protein|nr:ABC transporter substrate-binding protein [Polaribacter sp.]MBT5644820.1 ABC transporter substrate-binding protein [Polaribacter sp.]MBT7705770.1 ABC transporter substrate-binding protein [Polaribacter sp.]MDA9093204.1 ABC transporter substrate-binding protein [Polaribacter sp.]MDB4009498.1 ABC transporter substrate-binding protein [Polaribacter sp.]MDB4181418.1 ABC transporter substrate-binding protein [Polaribacter sp.]
MKITSLKIVLIASLLAIVSCKKEAQRAVLKSASAKITHAKGFDIVEEKGNKKLIIKSAYQNATEDATYPLSKKIPSTALANTKLNTIQIPVKNIVVTSTTHIPMVELLQSENAIVGFPHGQYVSSERTRKLLDAGKIAEIGKENSLNTEILLDLQPELVVGYSVTSPDKSLTTLQKAGINVIYNGDWLEETPLGKAEWIKFFGVLFDKEKQADSIFKAIETNYVNAKKTALLGLQKPTVLSGAIMSKDIWNLPAGESFVAQFLKDANLTYLWKDTKGKGSLSLSFESVFDKGANADIWIAPGYFTSKKQLLESNALYAKFKAFQDDNIYTPTTKKGKSGGVLYYELATTRPDLVLKDLIKITNPALLPDYELVFFEKMK